MRRVALLTLLTFGCATVREPERGAFAAPPARIALAEPELELWMEGTRPVDAAESARALEQSRNALTEALAGRGLDASEPSQLLVVRARAIARTDERRSAQVWSAVGLVAGFVVVALVVIALARSRASPSTSHASHAVASAPAARAPWRGVPFAPRPYPPPPPIGVEIGFNVMVPVGPAPPWPGAEPSESRLASRGWFDGDEVELTVELADPGTGTVSWRRTVREGADPRDPAALAALLDRALADQPFGARAGPRPPAQDTASGPKSLETPGGKG
ncbi:MAG TPA: hypothetical protein VF904_21105 [Anaeromyxobacteraceae bacterium]